VSLGGVFLLLAHYQILPQAINAMSELGVWGQVIGYGVMGTGLVVVAVSGVKRYAHRGAHTSNPTVHSQDMSENEEMLQAQQEKRAIAATSIQRAFRHHMTRQQLEKLKQKTTQAALTLQKHCRGYLIRKDVKEIKERERATLAIQSLLRMHAAQKALEHEKKHALNHSLFEKAKDYTEDTIKLACLPNASQGANSHKIYMPQNLPVVIRACDNITNTSRFPKMMQARTICFDNELRHVVVPKARLQGDFIIEERLPSENDSIIKGMVFYYENRELYTDAVKEFVSFLYYGYLGDIIGGITHIFKYLGDYQVPRFDNLW